MLLIEDPPPVMVCPPTLIDAPPVTFGSETILYSLGFAGLTVGSAIYISFP
jgi:hypothetical protein